MMRDLALLLIHLIVTIARLFGLGVTIKSSITIIQEGHPGRGSWNHMLLVETLPETEREKAHYVKTIRVLDGMTLVGEDFWISEQIQAGLDAGAVDELTLGLTENLIKRFHDSLDAAQA